MIDRSKYKKQLVTIIILSLICGLCSCASSSGSSETGDEESVITDEFTGKTQEEVSDDLKTEMSGKSDLDNPKYDNEQEGAVVEEKTAVESEFYGNWSADSQRAHYLYGNLNITIKEDGTWICNLSDEEFNGVWTYNGTGITMSSELVNADLFYAYNGSMMFRDHDSPEDLIVLTKVGS